MQTEGPQLGRGGVGVGRPHLNTFPGRPRAGDRRADRRVPRQSRDALSGLQPSRAPASQAWGLSSAGCQHSFWTPSTWVLGKQGAWDPENQTKVCVPLPVLHTLNCPGVSSHKFLSSDTFFVRKSDSESPANFKRPAFCHLQPPATA